MSSITEKLSSIVGDAFESLNLPKELGAVRVSDRPDLAQFQCNGAMAAAKAAKKNPREVAQSVIEILQERGEFEKVEIAGPGFINLDVTDSYLSNVLAENSQKAGFGVKPAGAGQKAILDYGGPNIAKAMHVGHLRASIIGDSVRRIMGFAGFKALGDVHMGDWGTPMGMLIAYRGLDENEPVIYPANYAGSHQPHKLVSNDLIQYLEEIYPKAAQLYKDDPDFSEKAREATYKLQKKEPGYWDIWANWRQVSINSMKKNFEALGVHFDLWKGEADVHDYIAPMVEEMKAQGIAVESDGALVVPVEQDDDKKEMPPLILYKRDGAVMYGTTDVATLVERMKLYDPARVIYIVDQRQSLHFEQVFRAARKSGIVPEGVELTHAGFGTMNGPDGKPFKTRAGGVMKLEDLIQMGIDKARERLNEARLAQDMDEEEREEVAHKVAIAAIKFADLQNNRVADYIFDIDRMTSFEGKTGPYVLYQAVRIGSLLRKAEFQNLRISESRKFVIEDGDRALALLLAEFPDHFEGALNNYAPHILAEYVYRLAQTFSSFYGQCHILSEENEALKQSRLALCANTYALIETCLGLLGIEIPRRM